MRLILSHDEVPKQEVMPHICWTTLCYTKANDQHFDSKDLYGSIPSPLPAKLILFWKTIHWYAWTMVLLYLDLPAYIPRDWKHVHRPANHLQSMRDLKFPCCTGEPTDLDAEWRNNQPLGQQTSSPNFVDGCPWTTSKWIRLGEKWGEMVVQSISKWDWTIRKKYP